MKVYPHKWQGAHHPIVATYDQGQKVPWLLSCRDGNVIAQCPGNGGSAFDRCHVAREAFDLYGRERLEKAFGQTITSVAYEELVS